MIEKFTKVNRWYSSAVLVPLFLLACTSSDNDVSATQGESGGLPWTTEMITSPESWVALGFEAFTDDNASGLTVKGYADERASNKLRLRLPLGNFAIRFGLTVCDEPTQITLREWRNEGAAEGLQLQLTENESQFRLNDSAKTPMYATLLSQPSTKQFVTITAIEDRVTLSINGQHVGQVDDQELPGRGIFSITPARCGSDVFNMDKLAWADLTTGKEEKLFYQTVDAPAAPVLSPNQALASFSIAPGFKVELVAAEPLVEDPVAMAWDGDGSLYVVEMRGYMPDAFGTGEEEPVGRVVRLEDTDADGVMDSQTVFLDHLVQPRAVAVVDGGILIGEPPHLWLCRDTTGDGICDDKRRIGDYGAGKGGSVEHRENGLLPGLDNWLYNAKSDRRLRVENGKLSEERTLFRGQWGISQDNDGRLLYNANSRLLMADLFPADLVLRNGAGSTIPGLSHQLNQKEEVFSVRVNPGINRAYVDGRLRKDGRLKRPTAVSGLTAYRGDQFPEAYNHDVFIPEPSANAVVQVRLSEQGIDLTSKHMVYPDKQWGQREFLASTDERFRPVDAKVGPDGALYVIDMYRGILQDIVFLTEELREQIFARALDKPIGRGRIWRIVKENQAIRRLPPQLTSADTQTLIRTLSHANGWSRDTAQRLLLAKRGDIDNNALKQLRLVASGKHTQGAIHALWTLQGLNALDRNTVVTALNHRKGSVAVQALRAGGELLAAKDILNALKKLPASENILRQQLVFSLRHHNGEADVQKVLQSLLENNINNSHLRIAVVVALRGQEIAVLKRLLNESFWHADNANKRDFITRLSAEVYRSLRTDITAKESASKALLALLDKAISQEGTLLWRQIAILEGLQQPAKDEKFKKVQLPQMHKVFSNHSLSELNVARQKGRMSFTWPGDEAANIQALTAAERKLMKKGKNIYIRVCANCHSAKGQGIAGLAPPLALSPWVNDSPEWLARIILQGLVGPVVVDGVTWDGVMPGHSSLPGFNDEVAAGLMTYLRRSWGNNRNSVTPEFIDQVKQATKGHNTPWTVAELKTVPK
jgi:mono/diheme cytochrome c family protein